VLARALWPYPRYVNSVLFLPGALIPRPAEAGNVAADRRNFPLPC
jgi:hypothetical protein